jgi:hypothetical protein
VEMLTQEHAPLSREFLSVIPVTIVVKDNKDFCQCVAVIFRLVSTADNFKSKTDLTAGICVECELLVCSLSVRCSYDCLRGVSILQAGGPHVAHSISVIAVDSVVK